MLSKIKHKHTTVHMYVSVRCFLVSEAIIIFWRGKRNWVVNRKTKYLVVPKAPMRRPGPRPGGEGGGHNG